MENNNCSINKEEFELIASTLSNDFNVTTSQHHNLCINKENSVTKGSNYVTKGDERCDEVTKNDDSDDVFKTEVVKMNSNNNKNDN